MSILQATILGIVQGLTEFFPISSSGHLTIAKEWLGLQNYSGMHLFLEFINVGTLIALVIYFWPRIIKICREIFIEHNFKFLVNVTITIIPAIAVGLILGDLIENSSFFNSLTIVAIMLFIVGAIMILVDKMPHMSKLENEEKLSRRRALYIGLAQIFAFIPGVSRSGSTMIAGRLVGLNNKSAANYSFLISIPIMLGVICKMLLSNSDRMFLMDNFPYLLLSNFCAFLAGFFAIRIAFRIYERRDALKIFGWYRIIVSSLILMIILLQI